MALFRRASIVLLLLSALLGAHAHAQKVGETLSAGSGIEYTLLGTYTQTQLRRFVTADSVTFLQGTASRFPSTYFPNRMQLVPKNDVMLYRVRYSSVIPERSSEAARATGLLAIPLVRGVQRFPLISYQHGIAFDRNAVPSNVMRQTSIDETKLMLGAFASQGYILIAADNVGLADSSAPNTFFVKDVTTRATLDMYLATQQVLTALKRSAGKLYLHGWSQGGYSTLLLLKELERRAIKVDAASIASAPADLRAWVYRVVNNRQTRDAPSLVATIAMLLMATDAYQQPGLAAEAIKPEYLGLAQQFYAAEIDYFTFYANTPRTLAEFLNPAFRTSGRLGETEFWRRLDAGQNYRWAMTTPVRTYHGDLDEVVPATIAQLPATVAGLFGTQTVAVSAGTLADHRGTFLFSIADAVAWHKQLPL